MSRPMLQLEDVHTRYGNIEALKGVSVEVRQGEIVTIIGSNGAGKSTLLMTICGSPQAAAGRILLNGEDITRTAPYDIVHLGISQAPEGRRIFARMSVLENLQMGSVPSGGRHFEEDVQKVFTLFPRLKERINQRGGTLSGGEQQMLCIGRALMARPRLLLLDEPSLGIAPILVRQIFNAIVEINKEQGLTILLVEQNAFQALKIAHRAYVLSTGRVVMEGAGRELLANPEVRAAYLEGGQKEVA
ncbi:ABC transporter ATP-binding protein [Arboricoccus pini]|nr:ABC transporter ATP-binding protein [Arboricoccus pini]